MSTQTPEQVFADITTQYEKIGYGHTAFILICAALVMLMTPGVGLLYSGLSRTKNALTVIMLSFLSYAIVTIQWVAFGYSLAFSETGSQFIGNFKYAGLTNIGAEPTGNLPVILFSLYQLQFATVTAAIIFGSVTERVRLLPSVLFVFVWTTLVYDPVTSWTWNVNGWLFKWGALDFAGGGPVHIASGVAALAFCIFLGERRRTLTGKFKPHNMTNVFLGTALLWFGWFGFNGGSALAANPRAAMAAFVTTISASAGALTWVLIDYIKIKKLSGLGFCSGAIAGLVGITPAAGFVAPWAAIVIGIITASACCTAIHYKDSIGYDDALDAFGLHGVGGFVGCVLTGFFADKNFVYSLDGVEINGGALMDGHWDILGINTLGALAIVAYSYVGTTAVLYAINAIPGLHFRPTAADEHLGGDQGEMGEVAYEIVNNGTALGKMKTIDEKEVDLENAFELAH
jgi:Amt family ammonium transporter